MMIDAALGYLDMGYRPIPLISGTKRSAVKWSVYRARPPTEAEIRSWFERGRRDVALVTGNGVVVVDVDDSTMMDVVLENCGFTPMRCRTPRGAHLYYSAPHGGLPTAVRVNGLPIDVRSDGATAVCPWSRSAAGVPYEWIDGIVPAAELPLIDASLASGTNAEEKIVTPDRWLCDPSTAVQTSFGDILAHVEGAISGQRGHDRTFRVACVLAIKFGLTLEQAWPLMREWNEQCEPPWSDKEIAHKLQDVFKLRFL